MKTRHTPRTGFTFIELLVCSAVMAVLVAMLLPAIQQAREAARRTTCKNNLKQINLALQTYHDQYEMLPAGTVNSTGPIRNVPSGFHHNWIIALLPHLDQHPADQQFDRTRDVYSLVHHEIRRHLIPTLLCPSDPARTHAGVTAETLEPALCNFAGNHHPWESPIDADNRGVLYLNSFLPLNQIADGTSHTIIVGEFQRAMDDLGWASGTRATLRNTWLPPNATPNGMAYYSDPSFHRAALADQGFAGWYRDWEPPDAGAYDVTNDDAEVIEEAPSVFEMAANGEYDFNIQFDDGPPQEAGLPPDLKSRLVEDPQLIVGGFGSAHVGGMHLGMSDGSVKFISENVGAQVWHQIGDRADGELQLDW